MNFHVIFRDNAFIVVDEANNQVDGSQVISFNVSANHISIVNGEPVISGDYTAEIVVPDGRTIRGVSVLL